jgi:hypothetical protein
MSYLEYVFNVLKWGCVCLFVCHLICDFGL